MRKQEGLGINSLGVAREVERGKMDLAFLLAALTAGQEELAGEYLVDKSVLVG